MLRSTSRRQNQIVLGLHVVCVPRFLRDVRGRGEKGVCKKMECWCYNWVVRKCFRGVTHPYPLSPTLQSITQRGMVIAKLMFNFSLSSAFSTPSANFSKKE